MGEKAVKVWLYRIRDIEADIAKLYDEKKIALNEVFPSGVRYDNEPVQTSPSDVFTNKMSKVIEIDNKIDALLAKRSTAVNEILDALCLLDDRSERLVLAGYFISCKSMSEVANAIPLDRRYTFKVKKKGIEHLSEILGEKTL